MKKIITITLVVSIFASVLLMAGGCAVFDSADAGNISSLDSPKEKHYSTFVENLYRDGATTSYWGGINYQILYEWKDINLDAIDTSFFDYIKQSKEDIADIIIEKDEQQEEWYISQYDSYFNDTTRVFTSYESITNIDKQYNVVYNLGHKELTEENEIIVPKWMYTLVYCSTLEEVSCDLKTVERILADGNIAQKYTFLGFVDFSENKDLDYRHFPYEQSLALSLVYYGIIDGSAQKDMTIYTQGICNPHVGHSGTPHELTIVGYYESPIEKIFDSALEMGENCSPLAEYLSKHVVLYFK